MVPWQFDVRDGANAVMQTLGVLNLDGFGIPDRPSRSGTRRRPARLRHGESLLTRPRISVASANTATSDTLQMDPATLRNLEIFRSSAMACARAPCSTPWTARPRPRARACFEQTLTEPPLDILMSSSADRPVSANFSAHPGLPPKLQEYLRGVRDLPRIVGRLRNGLRNPRELGAIRQTLHQLPAHPGRHPAV
jgi:DNA mismatch repair protein MutS